MTVLAWIVAVVGVLFAAWLRAAGTAMTRIPRADALRDASDNRRGAATVAEILENRDAIAPAIGVLASAFLVVGAVLATALVARDNSAVSLLSALAVGLAAFLIGDLVPRRLGRLEPERLAYRSHWVLHWAIRAGGWANDLIAEADNGGEEPVESDDEETEEHERELIDSVLEFSETLVREVMTPRPDMVTVDREASIEDLIRISAEDGYSRLPVTSNGDVVGMVIVKDLLRMLTDSEERPGKVADVMREVEFVPETKLAAALLAEMQEAHTHQVVVVDEYGEVAGLVTIEDLLEELVGEIADETDSDEALIVAQGNGWWVDARLPVGELLDITGTDIADHEFDGDTVGGLILDLAERVPEEGEVFALDHLDLKVTRMQGRRVAEVVVTISERIESR